MASSLDRTTLSPVVLARIAGVLALVGIAAGAFDMGYVRNALVVTGNVAQTVENVRAHETMFRFGFGAHLALLLCNVPGEIIFFVLFRRVNLILAAVIMACGLVGTAIEGLALLWAYVPLQLAGSAGLAAFTAEQLQTFSYQALQLENSGFLISFVFYGIDELLGGVLLFRSGFVPRILAVLYALSGFCYLSQGFISFVAPELEAHVFPWILLPCPVGEFSISLWFAVMGINLVKWQAWRSRPEFGAALEPSAR